MRRSAAAGRRRPSASPWFFMEMPRGGLGKQGSIGAEGWCKPKARTTKSLLIAERGHGVEAGGAHGRDGGCGQGDDQKQRADGDECWRVAGADAVEHSAKQTRQE